MRTIENSSSEALVAALPAKRNRSKQLRRQIAEESLQPGTSAAIVARRRCVNANQVFHWRKLLREGTLDAESTTTQLMPVRVTEVVEGRSDPVGQQAGAIHIELGRVHIRVEGVVDTTALRVILEHLGR